MFGTPPAELWASWRKLGDFDGAFSVRDLDLPLAAEPAV